MTENILIRLKVFSSAGGRQSADVKWKQIKCSKSRFNSSVNFDFVRVLSVTVASSYMHQDTRDWPDL